MTTPVPLRRNRLGFGIAAAALAVLAVGTLGVALSFPSGDFTLGLLGLALGGLAAVAWLVAAILALVVRRFSAALLVVPVLLGLVVVAERTDLPLRARFAAARPAFENVVAARGEAGPGASCPGRIGTYRVPYCTTDGSITRFSTAGGFLDAVGFAYAPDGVPAATGGDGSVDYDLLTGPWYTFSESF